jgi:tetraacyldisaccharide 4'-kinase
MRPCPHCFACRWLSHLYGFLVHLRQTLYRKGWLKIHTAHIPVVVVGNVSAGGTGKTPVCIRLIEELKSKGWQPGLVSRGYGRKSKGVLAVLTQSEPETVGDEALLIKQKTHVPVFVGENRFAAVQALLAQHPNTNVIVSDDGLQHYALDRNLEIILIDERTHANANLLPAGWLREPWPRRRVFDCPEILLQKPERSLVIPQQLRLLRDEGSFFAAVAAIGKPEPFFQGLKDQGFELMDTLALPDHDAFEESGRFELWCKSLPLDCHILCTEKDYVKIQRDAERTQTITAVGLKIELPPEFLSTLWLHLSPEPLSSASTTSLHKPWTPNSPPS